MPRAALSKTHSACIYCGNAKKNSIKSENKNKPTTQSVKDQQITTDKKCNFSIFFLKGCLISDWIDLRGLVG